jgi:hypothetical protein
MEMPQMMSDNYVDSISLSSINLWATLSSSTASNVARVPTALTWGRRVDSQTSSDLRKWVLTHNPQALQHLLPFKSLSLLHRTGSTL